MNEENKDWLPDLNEQLRKEISEVTGISEEDVSKVYTETLQNDTLLCKEFRIEGKKLVRLAQMLMLEAVSTPTNSKDIIILANDREKVILTTLTSLIVQVFPKKIGVRVANDLEQNIENMYDITGKFSNLKR